MQNLSPSDTPPLQTLSREVFWQQHITQWREGVEDTPVIVDDYRPTYTCHLSDDSDVLRPDMQQGSLR